MTRRVLPLAALALTCLMLGPARPAFAAAGVRVVPLAALASREAFVTMLSSAAASGDQSLFLLCGEAPFLRGAWAAPRRRRGAADLDQAARRDQIRL